MFTAAEEQEEEVAKKKKKKKRMTMMMMEIAGGGEVPIITVSCLVLPKRQTQSYCPRSSLKSIVVIYMPCLVWDLHTLFGVDFSEIGASPTDQSEVLSWW